MWNLEKRSQSHRNRVSHDYYQGLEFKEDGLMLVKGYKTSGIRE